MNYVIPQHMNDLPRAVIGQLKEGDTVQQARTGVMHKVANGRRVRVTQPPALGYVLCHTKLQTRTKDLA